MPPDHKDPQVLLATKALRARQDLKDHKDPQARPEILEPQVCQVIKVPLVSQDLKDHKDQPEPLAQQAQVDHKALEDHRDHKDPPDKTVAAPATMTI